MDLNHLQENYLGEKKNEEINHNYLFWATVFFWYINDNTCTKLYFEFTPFLGIFFQATIYTLFFQFLDDGRTKPEPRKGNLPEPQEYKCLIRANLGNKKISTVVSF